MHRLQTKNISDQVQSNLSQTFATARESASMSPPPPAPFSTRVPSNKTARRKSGRKKASSQNHVVETPSPAGRDGVEAEGSGSPQVTLTADQLSHIINEVLYLRDKLAAADKKVEGAMVASTEDGSLRKQMKQVNSGQRKLSDQVRKQQQLLCDIVDKISSSSLVKEHGVTFNFDAPSHIGTCASPQEFAEFCFD